MYSMLKAQELRECLDIRIWNQKKALISSRNL